MVKITLDEIKNVFLELMKEKRTLVNVSDWASKIIKLNDYRQLEYDPKERSTIFSALTFLCMIDLIDEHGQYFFSIESINDEFQSLFNDVKK